MLLTLPGDHGAINTWDRQAFITKVATGQPSFIPAVTEIHHNFIVADGDADGGAVDNDDGSSHYSIHHNFAVYLPRVTAGNTEHCIVQRDWDIGWDSTYVRIMVREYSHVLTSAPSRYGGAKINNIGGHSQTIFSNVFAFPNVYGPSCLWIGEWAKPGFGPHMYNNTCVLNPGDHYIDFLEPNAHCFFDLKQSFAPHFTSHDNRVLQNHWNTSKGLISGCFGRPPPPPPAQLRPVSACAQSFPNTSVSGGYEHDIHGLYEFPAATAEICRETCANYSFCSAGEWYLSEQDPGTVEPGTPPRNLEMLCYLYHLPAIAGPVGKASSRIGSDGLHTAFNCTQGLTPVPTNAPYNDWLGFENWTALGIDPGTTIAEQPAVEEIIEMGMSVLSSGGVSQFN